MKSIAVLAAFLILAGFSFSQFPGAISQCTIIQSSGTYNLTNDISGAPYPYYYGAYTTCIQINASSVTLDCMGHSINTTGNAAVEIEAPGSNVIVQNCVLNGGTGVEVLGLSGGRIIYNRINPSYAGIGGVLAFAGFTGSDILYNNITGGTYGIWEPGDSNLVGNNRLVNQNSIGLVDSGMGNTISNNYVSGSSGIGMMVNGQYSTTSSNTVTGCTESGIFTGAWNATISNNFVSANGEHGIRLGNGYYEANWVNVTGNQIWSNSGDGIHVEGGDYNRITSNEVYSNARGIYFVNGYYSEGGWSYARNNLISNNHVYSNTGNGIHTINTSLNNFTSNNASLNGGRGFVGENISNVRINPSTFCGNTGGEGVLVSSSTNVNILSSVACSNLYHGIHLSNTNYSNVSGNTAYNNGGDGIALDGGSSNNYVGANTAYGNTGIFAPGTGSDGIYLSDNANNNLVVGNTAYNNNNTGISVSFSTNDTLIGNNAYGQQRFYGIYLHDATNCNVTGNNAHDNLGNGGNGFVLLDGSGNVLTANNAYGNRVHGFDISSSNGNVLDSNDAYGNNQSGIIVRSSVSDNNVLQNNVAYANDYGITLASGSRYTNVTRNAAYNNRIAQMHIIDTLNATITNDEYSGSAFGAVIEGVSGGSFRMIYTQFTEPGGSFVNLTNLSITDTFGSTDNYTINWTQRTDSPTHNWHSFKNRTVNITDRETSSIDYIEFDWTASDAVGYNESNLGLWKYNSSGWTLMNSTPNTGAHHLSLTSMNPRSDYAIYEFIENCPVINVSGTTFVQSRNYAGAPNNATSLSGTACVKIAASNVIFDCNGYTITNNGTAGTTYGILINGSSTPLTNITIRDCPGISQYTNGIYGFETRGSLITNNTAFGNSNGIHVYSPSLNGYGNTISNNNASGNTNMGFYLLSNNNTFTNNTMLNDGTYGLASQSASGNNITFNRACGNTYNFLVDSTSSNNRILNNYACNGTYGFYQYINTNSLISGNNATGNNYGFNVQNSSNNNFTGNTVDGSTVSGIYARGCSANRFIGNTVTNSASHGFYLNTSTNNLLAGNDIRLNNYGIGLWSSSNNNVLENNTASMNTQAGIYIVTSAYNNLTNNTASNNSYGVYALSSLYNTMRSNTASGNSGSGFHFGTMAGNSLFVNNTASGNMIRGIYLASSGNSNLSGNSVFDNVQVGVYVLDSPNVIISNDHYFGNGDDFRVSGTGTVNLSGVSFDNPAGDFQNYTNLSLGDSMASESYLIRWTDNSTTLPLPVFTKSFRQKFITIENLTGNVSIDSIVWNWLDSELANYTESNFGVYEYNGSTWANTFATLATGSNTLSLANVSGFSVFALLQASSTESDGPVTEPTGEAYDVSIKPACQGFIVTVKDGGTPVPDAFITGTDVTHATELVPRYTNSSGQAFFPDCDIEISVKAVKEGREGTDAGMAGCGVCPQCATDDDCADSEQCSSQQCVPVNCPKGRVVDHACEPYECVDDRDCPVGQSCVDHHCKAVYECTYGMANTTADDNADCADNEYCDVPVGQPGGSCKPITGCGDIRNHAITLWECGDLEGCPSCAEGEACLAHKCVQSDLTCPSTGIVGDSKTCQAKEDNGPCIRCDYVVTDPSGKNFTGQTDDEGNFKLPLNLAGNYRVTLLKDGEVVKTILVKALPKSQPVDGEKPSTGGIDPLVGGLFLVILLALGLVAIMYWRRKGEKRKPEGKK